MVKSACLSRGFGVATPDESTTSSARLFLQRTMQFAQGTAQTPMQVTRPPSAEIEQWPAEQHVVLSRGTNQSPGAASAEGPASRSRSTRFRHANPDGQRG